MLQRKTYVMIRGRRLYENIYVALVGPPGLGKTTSIRLVRDLIVKIPTIRLSPTKSSKEKLINTMSKSQSVEVKNDQMVTHVSFNAFLDELGNFIAPNDIEFTFLLTELFDCPEVFTYETISRGTDRLENVHLNLLGGVTPASLAKILGPSAIGVGFTARLMMIFSEQETTQDPFDDPIGEGVEFPESIRGKALIRDAEIIHMLQGPFSFTPEAITYAREWYNDKMQPVPADSRFAEYNPRRFTHWIKLAVLRCASRTNDMVISRVDLERARVDLLEAEKFMPNAMSSIGANPLNEVIRNAHKWFLVQALVKKAALPESALRAYLMPNVHPQYLDTTISTMLSAGLIVAIGGEKPNRLLGPGKTALEL